MNALLEVDDVRKHADEIIIVDRVSFVAEAGNVTVVVGPNGAGKTTLFNCLAGFDPPDGGTVLHRGDDVTGWSADALARRGMARTFQRSAVFPTMTVFDNLRVAADHARRRSVVRGLLGIADPERRRRDTVVAEAMAVLNLGGVAGQLAGTLPLGTLRLVEIARALCLSPDMLLLDEPTSGLDDAQVEAFHQLLHGLTSRGLGVLMVEHDLELVQATAHQVIVMVAGRVVAQGTPGEVLSRPDIEATLSGRGV